MKAMEINFQNFEGGATFQENKKVRQTFAYCPKQNLPNELQQVAHYKVAFFSLSAQGLYYNFLEWR